MSRINRNQFLKKSIILAAATLTMPKTFYGMGTKARYHSGAALLPDDPGFSIKPGAIIDLHSHPSLKIYMLDRKMWNHHHPGPGPNITRMQEDLEQYSVGYVRGFMGTHYLPEASIEKDWDTVKKLWPTLSRLFRKLTDKIEKETPENFTQLKTMMQDLEDQTNYCNTIQNNFQFKLCKDFATFKAAMDAPQKTIPFAHAIEGAHSLGRNFPISKHGQQKKAAAGANAKTMFPNGDLTDASQYIKNLEEVHRCGTAMMGLSHFFPNDLAYPADGISPDEKKLPGMTWEYTPDQDRGLTVIGKKVVRRMLEIGMVVDLTHSAPGVRSDAIKINKEVNRRRSAEGMGPRPLIFSHTGAQVIYDEYDQNHYPYYKYYSVSDEEIAEIEACGGVIGVIPENFWLVGADTKLKKEFWPEQFKNGIPYMIQTMKYINSKTNSMDFSHVAIGSDFDGLADNPADLYTNSQLKDLVAAMQADPVIAPYVDKIMWQNSLGMLERGWGHGVPM